MNTASSELVATKVCDRASRSSQLGVISSPSVAHLPADPTVWYRVPKTLDSTAACTLSLSLSLSLSPIVGCCLRAHPYARKPLRRGSYHSDVFWAMRATSSRLFTSRIVKILGRLLVRESIRMTIAEWTNQQRRTEGGIWRRQSH